MPDQFFENPGDSTQEIEKIKLGDDEYSQEELQRLVGLGKIGLEAEERYKTRLDKVWPKYQQVINEKKALEDQYRSESEMRNRIAQEQSQPNQQTRELTKEEIRAQALQQAEELGIGPQAIRRAAMEVLQGHQLLNDINSVIDEMKDAGLPEETPEDILQYMQENGFKNPMKAYKDMHEKEWISSQAEKLNQIKHTGLSTISSSRAGAARMPVPTKITTGNLEDTLNAFFEGK